MSEAVRRDIVNQARHSAALEGQIPSPEQIADMELWIKGELTIDEMIENALERYTKGRR